MRLAVVLVLGLASPAQAQLNVRAIAASKADVVLRIGNRSLGRMTNVLCTIERYQGDWAWIHTDDDRRGWVKRGEVVPLEQAEEFFARKIADEPAVAVWRQRRAAVRAERGELDAALADISEAIRLEPGAADLRNSRGVIYAAQKEYDLALADYNAALAIEPGAAVYWYNAGNARLDKGEPDRAIRNYTKALELDPRDAAAYGNRGSAWQATRHYDRALTDYNQAVRLEPSDAAAYNNRAWLWATCPDEKYRDGKRALESATKACELSEWHERSFLDTLAAAYAETGDFSRAVEFAQRALSLASEEEKSDAAQRLKAYRAGQAWRESP